MPAVNLSPIFNGQQFFTTAGTPLSGGFINTYAAGTVTPAATYADSAGTILNSNPIQLDSAGLPPSEIWLVNATAYKFVVTDSLGANARTYDNVIAPLAASASALSYSTASNVIGFTAQTLAVGGFTGYQANNQLGTRVLNLMYWGASSSPLYGMTAGWSGLNTASGVGFTIGTNDTVRMSFSSSSADITAQGVAISRVKTATTSKASTTVVGDDPHLIATLAIGAWSFDLWLPVWGTGSGAGGFKFQMAFSGTTTSSAASATSYQNATFSAGVNFPFASPSTIGLIDVGTGITSVGWVRIVGTVTVSVAGSLSLQWAQAAPSGNATNVGIGGWMNCVKVG
jgi:hypothetical protein